MNVTSALNSARLNRPDLEANAAAGQKSLESARRLDAADAVEDDPEALREAFSTFMGETFYSQMIKSMRSTVDKPAYLHGGHAEEVFQSQLDQMLAQEMTEATADQLAGPMFDLFHLNMQRR